MNPNEEYIWESIKRKDRQAFESFYKEHYKLFFVTACQYLKDARLAQEVVNDVFIKIWQDAEAMNIQSSPKSYIYRSVVNRCLNELDKSKRDRVQLGEVTHGQEPRIEPREMEVNELKVRLYRAVDELPEQCRKVFMMSRFEGLKQQEIADLLGISIKTVKNHITHALKLLHKVLADWHSITLWIGVLKYFFRP